MKIPKSLMICISALSTLCVYGNSANWISFLDEVAGCRNDCTNRVYYAGSSNNVHFLYHESSKTTKEWQISNVNISQSAQHPYTQDRKKWITIKNDNDEKFSCWDMRRATLDFIKRLPLESALVSPVNEFFRTAGDRYYKDGTPMLICCRGYKVLATKSIKLHKGDIVSTSWLVDSYASTTNILANSNERQRHSVADGRVLYVSWGSKMIPRRDSNGYFCIGDEFAVPIELIWDSDIYHEALVPFEEKMVIDAYEAMVSPCDTKSCGKDQCQKDTPMPSMAGVQDFISAIVSVSSDQTNVVYYAGSSNDVSVLVHLTSSGERKWCVAKDRVERTIVMPYTENRDKWILLKSSDEECLRHWYWHKEIEEFVQSQPETSALVKPLSTFYLVDGDLKERNPLVVIVDEFSVDETLCDNLKIGDKLCTKQLYDGSKDEEQRIISEARRSGNPIVKRRLRDRGLCFAYWDQGKFVNIKGLPNETFFIIDNELVAPFEVAWNLRYDGLIHFEENVAIQAYKRRVEQARYIHSTEAQRN